MIPLEIGEAQTIDGVMVTSIRIRSHEKTFNCGFVYYPDSVNIGDQTNPPSDSNLRTLSLNIDNLANEIEDSILISQMEEIIKFIQTTCPEVATFQDLPFKADSAYSKKLIKELTDRGYIVIVQVYKTSVSTDAKFKSKDSTLMTILDARSKGFELKHLGIMPGHQIYSETGANSIYIWDRSKDSEDTNLEVGLGLTLLAVAMVNGKLVVIGNHIGLPVTSIDDRLDTACEAALAVRELALDYCSADEDVICVLQGDFTPLGKDLSQIRDDEQFGLVSSIISRSRNRFKNIHEIALLAKRSFNPIGLVCANYSVDNSLPTNYRLHENPNLSGVQEELVRGLIICHRDAKILSFVIDSDIATNHGALWSCISNIKRKQLMVEASNYEPKSNVFQKFGITQKSRRKTSTDFQSF